MSTRNKFYDKQMLVSKQETYQSNDELSKYEWYIFQTQCVFNFSATVYEIYQKLKA